MDHIFYLADVFTDRPFGGNQLAVLPDARGLSDRAMQTLAREFNFSETSFVLPPEDPAHTHRVRIFTPTAELPFAGHPTVGTAVVLAAHEGPPPGGRLLFEENVGVVAVDVDGGHARLTLNAPYEAPEASPDPGAVAAALSLAAPEVEEVWYGGVGLGFCYVRLADPGAVDRAAFHHAAWAAGPAAGWSPNFYVFAGEFRAGGRVHARAFVPGAGIVEDPATGSACAGLAAALTQRSPHPDGAHTLTITQGVAMGRPSHIEATATTANGRLTAVSVAGHTAVVARGTIAAPQEGHDPSTRP
ncbi:PhzF family phenazine biosynthesis protein [Streptomyces sp. DSM 44917]|uniref:PhzF family phenazine biosynthesis protein n=1 Tax=Streptomyces boetiae TaxID=3075541 RepID=A0ABU2L1D8_9ACTN|nr:PhzF family phenazine biosynthesis protein [Streptomyces sp. DSM 44917]MDT0305375.1 PhzF family phenazine biosynthesis protein [Streptomyces sp. DSM 44917]